jgi:hypothetical protein
MKIFSRVLRSERGYVLIIMPSMLTIRALTNGPRRIRTDSSMLSKSFFVFKKEIEYFQAIKSVRLKWAICFQVGSREH